MDVARAIATVERMYKRAVRRRPTQQRLERYYLGDQPLKYATDAWKKQHATRYAGFSDNWVASVVNAEAERIKHVGVRMPAKEAADREIEQQLATWWHANDGDAQQSQGIVTTLATARSYISVWPDEDGSPMMQWEHPDLCDIEYDPQYRRRRIHGLKTWADDDYKYATLLTPTHAWKFRRPRRAAPDDSRDYRHQLITGNTGWEPRLVTHEQWPLPHHMGDVPLVEVPNRPMLSADPISEVAGTAAMQDAANLMWAYLFVAADHASMPARVILNGERPQMPVLDEDGNISGWRPVDLEELAVSRMMTVGPSAQADGRGATIGEWSAAKLDVFSAVIEQAIGHVCAQTRTPPTYLISHVGMSNVSSEGLKASEIGLVKKVGEFHTFAGPALRDVYLLMARAASRPDVEAALAVSRMAWADAEIRSQAQLTDSLIKKRNMGYPLEYLLELDGLDPDEVARVMRMIDQEQEAGLVVGKPGMMLEGLSGLDAVEPPSPSELG